MYVCVCVYVYVNVCIDVHMTHALCTYIQSDRHTYMHAYMHAYMHICIHTYDVFSSASTLSPDHRIAYIHNTNIHTCIHACIHTYTYNIIHKSIHTYIHTHTHIHTYIGWPEGERALSVSNHSVTRWSNCIHTGAESCSRRTHRYRVHCDFGGKRWRLGVWGWGRQHCPL